MTGDRRYSDTPRRHVWQGWALEDVIEEKNVGITSARDTGVREDSCPHSQLVLVPQHCCLPAATSEFSNQACEGLTTEKLCGPDAYLAERQPFWVASCHGHPTTIRVTSEPRKGGRHYSKSPASEWQSSDSISSLWKPSEALSLPWRDVIGLSCIFSF